VSTIHYRLNNLREDGVIENDLYDLDHEALGLGVTVIVEVLADYEGPYEEFAEELLAVEGVTEAFFTMGETDFVVPRAALLVVGHRRAPHQRLRGDPGGRAHELDVHDRHPSRRVARAGDVRPRHADRGADGLRNGGLGGGGDGILRRIRRLRRSLINGCAVARASEQPPSAATRSACEVAGATRRLPENLRFSLDAVSARRANREAGRCGRCAVLCGAGFEGAAVRAAQAT